MLGFLLVGVAAGFLAMAVSLALGMSLWVGLILYSLVGSVVVLLSALARVALSDARVAARPEADLPAATAAAWDGPDPAEPLRSQAGEPAGLSQQSMRILVVDDDPFIRELLPKISAEAGFPDVTTVSSGQEALDLLAYGRDTFDCLLLDINMPEMDGIELCLHVRALAAYRDTPIIMLTAMRDMKNMDDAFCAGATDYATKPFDIVEFGTRLKAANLRSDMRAGTIPGLYAAGRAATDSALRGHGRQVDVQIEGVPNLIEHRALANYLTRLPRPEVAKVMVFAIKIEQADAYDPQAPTGRHLSVLREVALATGEVLGAGRGMMAYAGDGTFLVSTRATPAFAVDPETGINLMLARHRHRRGQAGAAEITVAVGEAIQPGGTKSLRAETAFKRAVAAVHDRVLFKQGQVRMLLRSRAERKA